MTIGGFLFMKRVGFIGLGLIGGSLAKAIRKYHPDYELLAYSRSRSTLENARKENVIHFNCSQYDPRFSTCDVIFLCAPVRANITYLPFLKEIIGPQCIISDVGSVKGNMEKAVEAAGLSANYIGGHPMTGSEKTGFQNSRHYLLENAYYFITPTEKSDPAAVGKYSEFVRSLKALPLVVSSQEHDRITAGVSHLPHLVAYTLVNTVKSLDNPSEHMRMVAAGGFRDITRIASSSPEMWKQICLSNKEYISQAVSAYIQNMEQARYMIDTEDTEGLLELFSDAKNYRDSLNDFLVGSVPRQYIIYVDLTDEVGGIATITTHLAMNAINIKNIGIVNNREFEDGVLRIEFYNEESRNSALELLTNRNYLVKKIT